MPEGLSPSEVGTKIAEHKAHYAEDGDAGRDHASAGSDHASRRLTIVEASLLALVAVLAAYSGFASAK